MTLATKFLTFDSEVVSSGTGTYSGIPGGTSVDFTPFTFVSMTLPSILWTLTYSAVTYELDPTSGAISFVNAGNIVIEGLGIAKATGFDDTFGTWSITANSAGATASFSSSASVVPEPATMLLLGSGLIGLAGFARRKFKK